MSSPFIELTVFSKAGGPLTKQISLAPDGSIISDGSACTMGGGTAHRVRIDGLDALAALIETLKSSQALALGALRSDLPDTVEIATKARLNGETRPDIIARTGANIVYRKNEPALLLLDHDAKGMPPEIAERMREVGGFWEALVSVAPELRTAAHLLRQSTSSGLMRKDTGERLGGSRGLHGYVIGRDGTDAERFLKTLHDRCWLAGLGWMIVGSAGQLLERSIVDRTVGGSERLVFEGRPVLDHPVQQDTASRRPIVTPGAIVDTRALCPDLTPVEQHELRRLLAAAAHALRPECSKAQLTYVAKQAAAHAARTGVSNEEAARVIERQCQGVLLADAVLPFDDGELEGCTVAEVLDNPGRFEGCTLADPIEGVSYGRGKAKVILRSDGGPWIHSFAHGRTTYQLKYDARAVSARLAQTPDPVAAVCRLALSAELTEVEKKQLIAEVARRAPQVGVRVITAQLKAALVEQDQRRAAEAKERRLAQRTDPRPQLPRPPADEPITQIMATVNEVLGKPPPRQRLRRDVDGATARRRRWPVPDMHPFTTANPEDDE
jgi:hypothetical protein